eukprot:4651048-Amphidinium_carterae.1
MHILSPVQGSIFAKEEGKATKGHAGDACSSNRSKGQGPAVLISTGPCHMNSLLWQAKTKGDGRSTGK